MEPSMFSSVEARMRTASAGALTASKVSRGGPVAVRRSGIRLPNFIALIILTYNVYVLVSNSSGACDTRCPEEGPRQLPLCAC